MYYRSPVQPQDQRFFGLPFLGGFAGGLLGGALISRRPNYWYPPPPRRHFILQDLAARRYMDTRTNWPQINSCSMSKGDFI